MLYIIDNGMHYSSHFTYFVEEDEFTKEQVFDLMSVTTKNSYDEQPKIIGVTQNATWYDDEPYKLEEIIDFYKMFERNYFDSYTREIYNRDFLPRQIVYKYPELCLKLLNRMNSHDNKNLPDAIKQVEEIIEGPDGKEED